MGLDSASTAVSALSARTAAGLKSASTAVGATDARSARNSPGWCSTLPLYYSSARDALGGGTRLTSVYFLLTSVTAAVSGVSLPLVASGLNSLCPLSYFIVATSDVQQRAAHVAEKFEPHEPSAIYLAKSDRRAGREWVRGDPASLASY